MVLMTGKNYYRKKKFSCLDGYVFWRVQITTGKITTGKKGTVGWPTVQINLVCCVKLQIPIITKLEKITTKKKDTVVWSSVGAQNTKHNTHRHNNQQDEPCQPTLKRL
jgi:hypothetical protein